MPKIYGYTEIQGDVIITGSFSILGSASTIDFDAEDGFLLAPNQGLVIYADNTIIAGAGCYGMLEWVEE